MYKEKKKASIWRRRRSQITSSIKVQNLHIEIRSYTKKTQERRHHHVMEVQTQSMIVPARHHHVMEIRPRA